MTFTVFLSHSSKDAHLIPIVKQATDHAGAVLYVAEHNITPGSDLPEKIKLNIDASNVVVWLVTNTAKHRG